MEDILKWLTKDPTGQKVMYGIVIVVALIALYALCSTLKWAAQNMKMLMGGGLLIGGLVFAGIYFEFGMEMWIVVAVIIVGAVGGLGFAMTMKD